jgi:iron complex outermembrane receptor protein
MRSRPFALAVAVAALAVVPVHGQQALPGAGALQEVTVTARRREERLQVTPESITVLDARTLERTGVARMNGIASLAPNLRFSDDQEVGASTITIRGVTQNRGSGEPPVALVVDGVALNNSLLSTQDFFDLEQVEVLRGPQGALFGRNAIGGAIVVTTRAPAREFEGRAQLSAAQGGEYGANVSASGPVDVGPLSGDALRFRLAGSWLTRAGQLRNEGLDTLVDFKESSGLRGRLLWTPTEALTVDAQAQYSRQQGGSGYFRPWSVSPFLLNTLYTIQGNLRGVSNVDFAQGSVKADWDFGPATLTSITALNHTWSGNLQDLDATSRAFLNIEVLDDVDTFVQELRLVSPAGQRLRWVAGLYLQDQQRKRVLQTILNVAPSFDPAQAIYIRPPAAAQDGTHRTEAIFAGVDFDLLPQVTLGVAGRFDRDASRDRTQRLARTFGKFQPKVQLAWRPYETLMAYATYSVGFRSGGFNNLAPGSTFAPGYEAESLRNYELGGKFTFASGRARLNGALFDIDYSNQQFFLFDARGTQAFVNAPKSRIRGGELELAASVRGGLELTLGGAFTHSRIVSFNDNPGLVVPPSAIVGRQVPNAPVDGVTVGITHTLPLGPRGLELVTRVDFEHRGTTYFTLDNIDRQRPYDLVNVRLSLERGAWHATLFARNLFGRSYQEWFFASRFVGLPTDISWPSPPRAFGVELVGAF